MSTEPLKNEPFNHQISMNVEDASEEEMREVLREIDTLSDDDLKITKTKHFQYKIVKSL